MPPERDEDRAHEEREQRALDDAMEAKRRASGFSPDELVDLERRVGPWKECVYKHPDAPTGVPPMSYVVRVVGPSGAERYLTADQREVERSADAEHHSNIIDAQGAADAYFDVARKCWPRPPSVDVVDQEGP